MIEPNAQTETDIRRDLFKFFNSLPGCVVAIKQPSTKNRSQLTPVGWTDIAGHIKGRALFVEVKKPGGAISMAQHEFVNEAKAQGCISFFAISVQDAREKLKTFGVLV